MKRFPFKAIRAAINQFEYKFDRINWGGCSVMAAILAYQLKPLADEVKIVAEGGWCGGNDVDNARKNMTDNNVGDWQDQGVYFNHVWVEFKWNGRWYAIDSEGLHRRKRMHKEWGTPQKGSFTLKEMRILAGDSCGWNPTFRREQIPAMKRLATKVFNPIKACMAA
jgi:hypothetical protein